MRTPERLKELKIAELNWCLEKLKFKELNSNGKAECIYRYIYDVIYKMNQMNAMDALRCYRDMIDDRIIEILLEYSIEI